jgi:hypothetical protein
MRGAARGPEFEADAFGVLQVGYDFKQLSGGGIPRRAKHLVKGLDVDLGMRGQAGKADRGIDVVAQEFFAEGHVAGEKAFDSLAQKTLPKGGIRFHARLNRLSEVSRQSHW